MGAHKFAHRNSDSHARSPTGVTAISASEFPASPLPASDSDTPQTARILPLPAAAAHGNGLAGAEFHDDIAPEDIFLDIDDLDAEACPPDRRYVLSSTREAWVYDHGGIADLVFVKVG
jgi:hypothetical protein